MSGLGKITYQILVDIVKNWLKTKCDNIANYNNISNVFKSGYSVSTALPNGNATATCYYNYEITENFINNVDASIVDMDMNNFLSQINVSSKLSSNIKDGDFINFINDMISFCSTKLAFSVSQYDQSKKYLIYNASNNNYYFSEKIKDVDTIRLIQAQDVIDILDIVINATKQNIRCIPCKYRIYYT